MRVKWPLLIAGGIVAGAIALTVHAYMLQGMGIPYPDHLRRDGWSAYPDFLFTTLAVVFLYSRLSQRLATLSVASRCLLLFVLVATIRESLVRPWFMELMDTTEMTLYPVVQALPKLGVLALLSCAVVAAFAWRRGNILAAVLLSALVFLVCKPAIDAVFAKILQSIAYLQRPTSYEPPYDYHILIPAYLTFAEPVIGCLAAGLLAWDRLPASRFKRVGLFALLVLLIKGPTATAFMYMTYSGLPPWLGLLSVGQFTLEAAALGLLTALALEVAISPGSSPASAQYTHDSPAKR